MKPWNGVLGVHMGNGKHRKGHREVQVVLSQELLEGLQGGVSGRGQELDQRGYMMI